MVSLPDGQDWLDIASKLLGVPGVSANKLINAAILLYQGEDRDAVARSISTPMSDLTGRVKTAKVKTEILDGIENISGAIRIGIGLAMGLTREQAESWASLVEQGGKREGAGRPRKTPETQT